MFYDIKKQVLQEITNVLSKIEESQVENLTEAIARAENIVTCGAGRMGMMARAFAMRLSHLNLKAYHISDCNTPCIGKKDLLLVCSGSGETKTILLLVEIAKKHGASVALISSRPRSSMSILSDVTVIISAPSKCEDTLGSSIQPMTTLTEQSCLIFFDILVLLLMKQLNQTHDMLKTRHSVLE